MRQINVEFVRYVLWVIFILFWNNTYAQSVSFDWVKGIGEVSPGNKQEGTQVATDGQGNVYISGYFQGKVDFDSGVDTFYMTATPSRMDLFICKIDGQGNFLWARQISGTDQSNDYIGQMKVDIEGNVFFNGSFEKTVDFDPGPGVYNLIANRSNMFIVKLDSSGNFKWAKQIGGDAASAHVFGWGLFLDQRGFVYTTGVAGGVVDFDPGPGRAELSNGSLFVLKLSPEGDYVWVQATGGGLSSAKRITVDVAGSVYFAGQFSGVVDFDPGWGTFHTFNLSSFGSEDVFITKLDSTGNFVWAKQFGGSDYSRISSITVDDACHIYITGSYSKQMDADPGSGVYPLNSIGSNDIYHIKLDSSGQFIWAASIGGGGNDEGKGSCVDKEGNTYISGFMNGKVDFDPGPEHFYLSSNGGKGMFVAKLSAAGKFLDAKVIGNGTAALQANDICLDQERNIYTTGYYNVGTPGTTDFDPGPGVAGLTPVTTFDAFIHKMKQVSCTPTLSSLALEACDEVVFAGNTYTTTGIYSHPFVNAAGCDSIVTLHLVIKKNGSSRRDTACTTFTLNNQTYATTGVYTQRFTNVLGCDSIVTLNLVITGPSRLSLPLVTACDSVVVNGRTYKETGNGFIQNYTNWRGCDSIVTVRVRINKRGYDTLVTTVCDSLFLNGHTYNSSGIYVQTIPMANGCDSILTVRLEVQHSIYPDTLVLASCEQYTWNETVYKQSGIYTHHYTSSTGCDSVITLALTIDNLDVEIVQDQQELKATVEGAEYQWLECMGKGSQIIPQATGQTFKPDIAGAYAVVVRQKKCTDTSECIFVYVPQNSIANRQVSDVYSLYPNPTEGLIRLASSGYFRPGTQVRLVNLLGQSILAIDRIEGTILPLDLSNYPSGIYLLQIQEGSHKLQYKIVKK